MKKLLYCFAFLGIFVQYSMAQCKRCYQHELSQDTISIQGTDFSKRFPNAKNVQWKFCKDESQNILFAVFNQKDTTYSVMYNMKKQWIATEKRVFTNVKAYDWEREQTLDTEIRIPSPKIFSAQVISVMKDKNYNFDIKNYLNINNEKDAGGFCDYYNITLDKNHKLSQKHKSTSFDVVNLDGVYFVYANKKLVEQEFYDFYEE